MEYTLVQSVRFTVVYMGSQIYTESGVRMRKTKNRTPPLHTLVQLKVCLDSWKCCVLSSYSCSSSRV